jgi:cellulose synthase/poly-beta-1,6-N-acetylglucosamine synthase-like glycosyltransferase
MSMRKAPISFFSRLPNSFGNRSKLVVFDDDEQETHGNGFHFRGAPYVLHTDLDPEKLAVYRASPTQILVLVLIALLAVLGFVWHWHTTLVLVVSVVTILYFADLSFSFYLIYRSFFKQVDIRVKPSELAVIRDWPSYTVFCPLYKEWAVLPQFTRAMSQLDYPKDKLEVMLLLEQDDEETIQHAAKMGLPKYFQVVVVPHSAPKTKPKACNYGLQLATGEYAVIYDAEDIPEREQLKKAVLAFERLDDKVFCLQAKLNFYNISQNLLTRLFTLEYSLWFDLVLTGLQGAGAPIPLGGTSNHFKTSNLRKIKGWDPFNVTEDADLGMRIAKRGFRTAVLDSTTMEEANSQFGNWLKQRSRWVKGYFQTYLVHMRGVGAWRQSRSPLDVVTFQLVVGGKVLSMLLNPLLWLMTIAYFAFRPVVGEFVQSLYVAPVFYAGLFSLVIGNFLYTYYYMMGAARRGQWEIMLDALLVPFYWLAMSAAAYFALWELLVRPYYWHKTKHGLHLKSAEHREQAETLVS